MSYKIMIVEDEAQIRSVITAYLENAGFEVIEAQNGFDGLALFESKSPALVVLDVMMPGISGFEVLSEIRRISQVPVIMLTAKQQEDDRINGFDLGADDYVSKPFSPRELVKRIEAIIKRTYGDEALHNTIKCDDLVLDLKKQALFKAGTEIEITSKEFEILCVFFMNQGQLLTREQLIENAFGAEYDGFDRNVDSYIKKIRHKIEINSRDPRYLRTKYGAGYIFGGGERDA